MKNFTFYGLLFGCLLTCSSLAPNLAAQIQLNPNPTRVIGQNTLAGNGLNLVEGRELNSPQGIALDLSVSPPLLYVADTGNNRVLGFKNAAAFANGQKADIVIGQVDLISTTPQGPLGGNSRSIGLFAPTGLVVDSSGSVYVVDSGNNRILRFPSPFQQANIFPDFVIGQTSFTGRAANAGGISASTLALNTGGIFQAYITFDSAGALWVADPGNFRVLRFPASQLVAGLAKAPVADVVLGQLDFISALTPPTVFDASSLTVLNVPTGLTFDAGGRLYVSESPGNTRSRVLIFSPPFTTAKPATRIIGVVPASVTPQPPNISEQQFREGVGALFAINGGLGVVDTRNSRLLTYTPFQNFTVNNLTQQAQGVFGQPDFSSGQLNAGQAEASATVLSQPTAVAVSATELYIVDSGNNRVIAVPYTPVSIGPGATRVLGQDAFNFSAPNLAEGREFRFLSTNGTFDAGVATDLTSDTPHLYVADTYNNRVLCYRDLRTVKPGDKADLVIGQPDFQHTGANFPNNTQTPTPQSLFAPTGVTVDKAGNLFVADSGNSRVIRFPAPFTSGKNFPAADLVLGQSNLSASPIKVASNVTMSAPYGLAFATPGGILVSDVNLNRVLYFAPPLISGMSASKVFGQPDFNSSLTSSSPPEDNRMSAPHHISTDTDDRLYVADSGNGRLLMFDRAPNAGSDPRAGTRVDGLSSPRGVYVNPRTAEIWVTSGATMIKYTNFASLVLTGNTPAAILPDSGGPLALTQDGFGNLYTADAAYRVQINFPTLSILNGASFVVGRALAPGTVASIFGFTNQFGTVSQAFSALPLPTSLANTQVLFNGVPVPLYYVSPGQINFQVPNSAPTSGTADLQVVKADTGQILGNFPVALDVASPALFTASGGSGQVAAINQDGTVNGKDHPAPNKSVVAFYGTGQGYLSNAPADGTAATGLIGTPYTPFVIIGTAQVPTANVVFSGLAPGLVGVWQVNVLIPDNVAPTATTNNITPVVFVVNTIPSNGFATGRLSTTMWVAAPK